MKQKQIQHLNKWVVISILIFFIFGFLMFLWIYELNRSAILEQEVLLFKTILYADSKASDVSIDTQKAESYYLEAGYFYEKEDYNNVESSCRLARGYYSTASQGYRKIKSELESSKIQDKLIDIYIESLGILSEIRLNMYEACEHFESASRYYDTYYNTNVPYDDMSFDMGGAEMDSMNVKIRLHDENVRKYNDLLGDFEVELEKRLE